jgi:hypothetical protein
MLDPKRRMTWKPFLVLFVKVLFGIFNDIHWLMILLSSYKLEKMAIPQLLTNKGSMVINHIKSSKVRLIRRSFEINSLVKCPRMFSTTSAAASIVPKSNPAFTNLLDSTQREQVGSTRTVLQDLHGQLIELGTPVDELQVIRDAISQMDDLFMVCVAGAVFYSFLPCFRICSVFSFLLR